MTPKFDIAGAPVGSPRRIRSRLRGFRCGLTVGCVGTLLAGRVPAQSSGPDSISARVDQAVLAELGRQKIPGISLGVVRDGRIVKAKGYGLANVELAVPVTPRSVFQTGSVGKQFTAAAVMMLVEEGRVDLDDSIPKYFPEAPPSWKAVTVRQLLTHTSGIADYGGEESTMGKGVIDFRRDYTEDELIRTFAPMPPEFAPGEKFSYSNTGYVLLGVLIHRVTGKFYGDFLQERIFRPLGMTATRIISEADIIPDRSSGYRLVNGELKNQEWVSPSLNTTADGALYTNVLDLAKWDAALYTERLLKRASFDQMWSPVKLNSGETYPYGFGWRITSVNGHRLLGHGGAWQGFTMSIYRYVDDRLTIVVLTNLDENNSRPEDVAARVAAIYIPDLARGGRASK
jgi:CubicO group peptidase (beta-lactamase class C family)